MKRRFLCGLALVMALTMLFCSCDLFKPEEPEAPIQLTDIPAFNGTDAYININGGVPFFTDEEKQTTNSYESYESLDALGRCTKTHACIGKDLMPEDEREPLYVEPSGWVQAKYNGQYLYNRCHLIGFQLTGENNNNRNLITGTRYLNIEGMLPFENMVADYIKETGNHVMLRVTPIYVGEYDLVASGVLMEGYSVEDEGEGICFNVYCYNVQPGVVIDYADGTSRADLNSGLSKDDNEDTAQAYVLNKSSKKIHKPECSSATDMKEENKEVFTGDINEKINEGYTACGSCKPLG